MFAPTLKSGGGLPRCPVSYAFAVYKSHKRNKENIFKDKYIKSVDHGDTGVRLHFSFIEGGDISAEFVTLFLTTGN